MYIQYNVTSEPEVSDETVALLPYNVYDFLIPVFVVEALQCLRCSDTFEPRLCNRIEVCNKGEVCGVRLYRSDNGDVSYWTGCMSSLDCTKTINRTVVHPKRDGSSHIPGQLLCTDCCVGDMCNSEGCGADGYPISRGPLCYDCRDIHAPGDCHKIVPCSLNEKCLLEERTVFGQRYFTSRCEHGQTCDSLVHIPFGRKRATAVKCHQCCDGDLCNNNCNLANSVGGSTTPGTVMSSSSSAPYTSYSVAFFTQNNQTVTGPGSRDIIFDQTAINIGGGYASSTGIFLCPQAGLYMFAWGIVSHGNGVDTSLMKNGYPVGVAAITDPKASTVDDSSTSFAVLRLNKNDKINVHQFSGSRTISSFFAGWKIYDGPLDRNIDAFTTALNHSSYSSTTVPFNSVIFDNKGSYRTGNQTFVADSPGLYVFGVSGQQSGSQYDDLQIKVNAAQKLNTFPDSESGHSDSGATLAVLNLNSHDNVNIGGRHYVGYRGTTAFSGYKIANVTTPAFTAVLTSDSTSTVVPFSDVLLDTHHDFNRLTGVFTCSVSGTYLFTWTVETNGAELETQLIIQRKVGSQISGPKTFGEETKGDEYDSSTGVFIYGLSTGDTVSIRRVRGKVEGSYSSFSGWLLF
ncbi:uncharacterized protein LOC133189656 [Saccostrea echinata]|uniref:uncharacterized protein LOC133189656 n=1 Tax=Saccostrea echinata TaxID=191078 RepID=UPI002A81B6B6|nr:uncharacterized protein LOC133189656 [Saccostrea echinata]